MGLAERCLTPPTSHDNSSIPFPTSIVPGWRLGDPVDVHPKVPFYRAAAVGSLLAHVLVLVIAGAAVAEMLRQGWDVEKCPKWYHGFLLRLPVMTIVAADALLLDGGVGGGATAVGARGVVELGYLCCGVAGPIMTIVMLGVLTWRREGYYDAGWLLISAAPHKRRAMLARRHTALGIMHLWIVGMGAWRVDGFDRVAMAAFSKHWGPPAAGRYPPSIRARIAPFYSVVGLVANIIMSGARAGASTASCVWPSAVIASVCTVMMVLFIVLRPMTGAVKNAVGFFLSVYATVNGWALLAAAARSSPDLIRMSLVMAEGQAFLSGVGVVLTALSFVLSTWAGRAAHAEKRAQGEDDMAGETPLLQLPPPTEEGSGGATAADKNTTASTEVDELMNWLDIAIHPSPETERTRSVTSEERAAEEDLRDFIDASIGAATAAVRPEMPLLHLPAVRR